MTAWHVLRSPYVFMDRLVIKEQKILITFSATLSFSLEFFLWVLRGVLPFSFQVASCRSCQEKMSLESLWSDHIS